FFFFFSSRRRHTRWPRDWSSDVCSSDLEIECRTDVSSAVPLEIGFPLFRVLQEAVHNAVKYSGVGRVEVQLREVPGAIHLIIRRSEERRVGKECSSRWATYR